MNDLAKRGPIIQPVNSLLNVSCRQIVKSRSLPDSDYAPTKSGTFTSIEIERDGETMILPDSISV